MLELEKHFTVANVIICNLKDYWCMIKAIEWNTTKKTGYSEGLKESYPDC